MGVEEEWVTAAAISAERLQCDAGRFDASLFGRDAVPHYVGDAVRGKRAVFFFC